MIEKLNLRVYGIVVNNTNEVLLTDEERFGIQFTKFPGGGLELGEGIIDCLKREFQEELEKEVKVIKHFYTTDFFQLSAFNNKEQVISVYYLVEFLSMKDYELETAQYRFQFEGKEQIFRWEKIDNLSEKSFTFPIDKIVGEMLKSTEF